MSSQVACVGILVADVVGKPIDSLPERGKLALVDRMELHSGGCAANTAISLARLGVNTAVFGKVGQDGFGEFLERRLRDCGVDATGIVRDSKAATSSTMVLVHGDGERSFIHYLGANAQFSAADVDIKSALDCRILHIAGALVMPALDGEPTAEILRGAKRAGVTTSLDTVWDAAGGWLRTLAPCLPYVDYIMPNLEEARMLAGPAQEPAEVASALLDAGAGTVVLKMAERGCYIRTRRGEELEIGAAPAAPVDALGAGDAFVAGFLAGLLKGWDLRSCGALANRVGADCVSALGATTGVRSLPDTLASARATYPFLPCGDA